MEGGRSAVEECAVEISMMSLCDVFDTAAMSHNSLSSLSIFVERKSVADAIETIFAIGPYAIVSCLRRA